MMPINAWTLLGGFLASGLVFALALIAAQRAPSSAWAEPEAPKPRDLHLVNPGETGGESGALRRQLAQAGFDHPDAPRYFVWAKVVGALSGLGAGILLLQIVPAFRSLAPTGRISLVLSACVLFYFVPVMVVDKRRAAYKRRLELALPDALDLMLVCIEAGQSIDLALMRVADELNAVHPDLAARFYALTEALAAGADRHDAWMRMAAEAENDDLRQFASVMVQSSTLGTPMSQTLRAFTADLRDRRVRKVEERANVLPTKMTLGTMVFTIPPLLILLLAPSIYRLSQSF